LGLRCLEPSASMASLKASETLCADASISSSLAPSPTGWSQDRALRTRSSQSPALLAGIVRPALTAACLGASWVRRVASTGRWSVRKPRSLRGAASPNYAGAKKLSIVPPRAWVGWLTTRGVRPSPWVHSTNLLALLVTFLLPLSHSRCFSLKSPATTTISRP
jgi:hypothetical protein